MKNIIGFGKEPSYLQPDEDLEMNLKILLQTLSCESLKESQSDKALSNLLSIIQARLELTKGYLAALQGTSLRESQSLLISRSQLQKTMSQQSVILSEALEMTWNTLQVLDLTIQSLQERNV